VTGFGSFKQMFDFYRNVGRSPTFFFVYQQYPVHK